MAPLGAKWYFFFSATALFRGKYVLYIYHRVADTVTFDSKRRHGIQRVNGWLKKSSKVC
jgi:hypothetical protein